MDASATSRRPLRIAMIGQRGVPATFGGIEHHVEELGARLAGLGHEVTVYCRSSYARVSKAGAREHRGMRLAYAPTASTKHLDALVHSASSTVVAMRCRPDIVHYHALGPGLLAPLPRYLSRAKVVLTVHGLDNERAKWGRAAQAVLGGAHWMSARVPDATVVVSRALAEHYAACFARTTTYIPNGVEEPVVPPADEIVRRLGLRPSGYLLFVGRLVPEKAPDLLIRAYRQMPGDLPLVIAGDSSFTAEYVGRLRRAAADDSRVVLTGYVYGRLLAELYAHAAAFVLPSLLEGLPLTLLEAASFGVPVVASDIAPHREVLEADGPGHRLFGAGDEQGLTATLIRALADPEAERRGAKTLRQRVLEEYRWDDAARATEQLYLMLAGHPTRRRSRP
jgi:glycosyltransferase involved in cell wall biosynthesis